MNNLTKAFLNTVEASGDLKILSPNETLNELGTKEEFERREPLSNCCGAKVSHLDNTGNIAMCNECKEWCGISNEEEDYDAMEDNNRLDLMESQMADCEDLEN